MIVPLDEGEVGELIEWEDWVLLVPMPRHLKILSVTLITLPEDSQ